MEFSLISLPQVYGNGTGKDRQAMVGLWNALKVCSLATALPSLRANHCVVVEFKQFSQHPSDKEQSKCVRREQLGFVPCCFVWVPCDSSEVGGDRLD
jgi:hypothetical protein